MCDSYTGSYFTIMCEPTCSWYLRCSSHDCEGTSIDADAVGRSDQSVPGPKATATRYRVLRLATWNKLSRYGLSVICLCETLGVDRELCHRPLTRTRRRFRLGPSCGLWKAVQTCGPTRPRSRPVPTSGSTAVGQQPAGSSLLRAELPSCWWWP